MKIENSDARPPTLPSIQRMLVLAWLAAVLGMAGTWIGGEMRVHAVVALTVLLFGHAIVMAAEFALMVIVGRHTSSGSISAKSLLRAWVLECVTGVRVFGWQQPFRNRAFPEELNPSHQGRRGVLLVHGFACSRGLWLPWLERLAARDVPFVAIDLEPPWAAIGAHRPLIEEAVARLERSTGLAPVVVAHSMGGLAVRAWWKEATPDRIHRLLTLGSPHHGTWMARFGVGPSVRQMRLGSAWLMALLEGEGPARWSRTTCYYSLYDNIVFPARSATLPGAENRLVQGEPHLHMIWSRAIWIDVLRWLDLPGQDPQPAD